MQCGQHVIEGDLLGRCSRDLARGTDRWTRALPVGLEEEVN